MWLQSSGQPQAPPWGAVVRGTVMACRNEPIWCTMLPRQHIAAGAQPQHGGFPKQSSLPRLALTRSAAARMNEAEEKAARDLYDTLCTADVRRLQAALVPAGQYPGVINKLAHDGQAPLHVAAGQHNEEAVRLLLLYG